ncbi:MAG: xanthine dehydrogenase accessory protein XdhC [Caldithrix sp.]|nr:xanthine dehydrogenase accessory protein XdhC [Caldithrix sp.]
MDRKATRMDTIYHRLIEALENNESGVMLTITEVKGSVPRHSGSKMLVLDGGQTVGSIGGGRLEHDLMDEARQLLQNPQMKQKTYNLDEDKGMACGGQVTVLFEPFGRLPQLLIFGAGHIAQALAPLAENCGFHVAVADNRAEFATSERFPQVNTIYCDAYETIMPQIEFTTDTYIVIVTHGHAHDEDILQYCVGQPFAYLGMIGSKKKVQKTFRRLREASIPDDQLNRVHSPIGLHIGAETPAEIAVSIMAEMVAVRHGVDVTPVAMKLNQSQLLNQT